MTSTFDFVVVGAGASGGLLAKRLAESPSKPSVALVEAGSQHEGTALRRTHDRFALAFTRPDLDYGYKSVPQPKLGGRDIDMIRGRGLGGSTQTNFQVWSLGSKAEFDAWAAAVDGPEWSFDSVLNSIRKFERLAVDLPKGQGWDRYVQLTEGAHGFSGQVDVSIGGELEPEVKHLIDAGVEAGYALNLDQNDGNPIGIGLVPSSNLKGFRTTSASAFLDGEKLPNLTIITNTQVTKVLFEGNRASGVQASTGIQIFASKEIILSAGAIDTPKLLLLSGVGPKDQLQSLGIESKVDLPVGQNFIDHPYVPLTYHMVPGFTERLQFRNDPAGFKKALHELEAGKGPLTKHYSSTPLAFLKSPELYESAEFAALPKQTQALLAQPTVPSFEYAIGGPLLPPDYHFDDEDDSDDSPSFLNFFVTLMNSQSRGHVKLASADPLDKPVIDPRYLENPYDQLVLRTAIREALQWVDAPALKSRVKKSILAPASASDTDIEAFISVVGGPLHHPSCTVKMGRPDDPEACVDRDLKLRGLTGLRVADLSVPPELPSGHPQIVAYAIGQIAADKIRAEWDL